MYAFIKELEAIDRQNERKSAIATFLIIFIIFAMSILWRVFRDDVPPPEEEYQVMGSIDFGNMTMGSRQVNNYLPPKPDPAPSQPPPSESKPVEQEPEPEVEPDPIVTQKAPSPVEVPETKPVETPPKPKPKPKVEKPKPKPKPQPKVEPKTEPKKEEAPAPSRPLPSYNPSSKPAGSNDGTNDSGTGNKGKPVEVLDPRGMYTFGTGGGEGNFGRGVVKLGYPNYNVQEEGEVKFKFVIAPNGTVANVSPVPPVIKRQLVALGRATIMKWKFSPLPAGRSQRNQTVYVTMKFKLTN